MRLWPSLLLLVACHPRRIEIPPAKPIDPLAHHWKIYGHVMTERAAVTDDDAAALDGRDVDIGETTYEAPFQGHCGAYAFTRRARPLTEIASELGVARAGLGLGDDVLQFHLTCPQQRTAPPLELVVDPAGQHALTCWTGVCYLLGL